MTNRTVFVSVLTAAIIAAAAGSYVLVAQGDTLTEMTTDELRFTGFGAETTGGAGGRLVSVTNLDNSGEGSLRWALEELTEKRIVQFDVSGVIQLEGQIEVAGDVSVLGQTSEPVLS